MRTINFILHLVKMIFLTKKISSLKTKSLKIINLGQMPRKKILKFYNEKVGTLIFPSLDESFGILFIEATIYKKNIIVSNSNYSDLLNNYEKLNPYSVNSISKN